MLRTGDKIGPYSLVREIGRGGFGVVWLAERRTTIATTRFALKLPKDDLLDADSIKREAEVWVQASGHPNILSIIEADVYDGQIVIVSEFAPDGSLSEWLEKRGGSAPSVDEVADLMLGVVAGLHHLHTRPQPIIHRDLKPQNILLQGDMPRLADFGIARLLKSSARSIAERPRTLRSVLAT
jgi:serine/threonine protein kinase